MQIEFDKIAEYMGELCGAARYDWTIASPEDVGLNGVSILGWREAYFEGCKDMAEGIATRLPEEHRDRVREIVCRAFDKTFAEAKRAHDESLGSIKTVVKE